MARRLRIHNLTGALLLVLAVLSPTIIQGRSATPAPPMAAPTGTVVDVATEAELQLAVQQLASGTTIVLAPGVYRLTSTLYVNGAFANVTIRGGTDNPDDVVLVGSGMTNAAYGDVPHGIWIGGGVQGVTIANLTIRDVYAHAIVFNKGTDSPHVYNVHLIDAGQQFIRSNSDGVSGGVDNGIVEYSVIEYTTTATDSNSGGVEVQGGAKWIVRHNLFRNIVAPAGELAGPAVLVWGGSSGTLTEGNTFLNCARGIAYGLVDKDGAFDHRGGSIRNNFIHRSSTQPGGVAIAIADSPNTKVLNNTVYLSGTYATPIEYRFAGTTGVALKNNLLDGFLWALDGATGTEQNNLTGATADMFQDAAAGDLHLSASATSAIDHGVTLASVTDDWDGQARPADAAQDIGADEYGTSDTTTAAATEPMTDPDSDPSEASDGSAADAAAAAVPTSIWSASATPDRIETSDASAVELGVRFRADTDGTITGVRFYKGASNTGSHTGSLWTNAGVRLATATFTSETASGWQQVAFSAPVAVTANTTYVASYHTNVGQYGVSNAFFTTSVDNPPLHALADGVGGANGVYRYGASAFPAQTFQSANYWVDVVFMAGGGTDSTAPTVAMTAPAAGATVSGTAVNVTATATDNVGVVGVQFKVDGANVASEDTASPYSLSWNTTLFTNGTHSVSAVARDAAGNLTTAAAVTVTVNNAAGGDTTPPVVSITTPSSGATVSGSGVMVSVAATDNVGVVGVQFKVDGANVASEFTATPYSLSWTTTFWANGTHTVTAVARDAAGNTTTAAAVTVTINNGGDTTPPTVSITAPGSGATVSGSAVTLSATASDSVGVAGVQFKVDGVNLGAEDTATPYALTWNTTTATNGTHSVSAVARDAAGNQTTAAAVTVTVNNAAGGDTTPPVVSITTPSSGATVSGSGVMVSVAATDNVGVVGVQFKVDGANVASEFTATPYTLSWTTTFWANGTHTVTAVARDAAGNTTTAAAVTVTINNGGDTTPPTVSITAPGSGATVSGSAVTLSATASDGVGVAGVQFKVDGVNLGAEDTTTAYSLTWNTTTIANGTHTVTAVARDAAGNTTTAAAVTVTVSNSAALPTSVIFTASTDHSFVTSYLLEVFANGANPNTASPVATSNLGKPTPAANRDITVDQTSFFNGLVPGTYVVTVSALAPGGRGRSAAVTVTR